MGLMEIMQTQNLKTYAKTSSYLSENIPCHIDIFTKLVKIIWVSVSLQIPAIFHENWRTQILLGVSGEKKRTIVFNFGTCVTIRILFTHEYIHILTILMQCLFFN